MKKILIISVLFFLGICSFFQIKVEKYRIDLIKNYNFSYLQQKRVKYTPFIFFYMKSKLLKQNKDYFKIINLPYQNYEKENKIVRKQNEEYELIYNIEYNAYLMYCYCNLKKRECK